MNTFWLQTSRTFCGDPVGKIPPPNALGQHLAALGIPIVNDKLWGNRLGVTPAIRAIPYYTEQFRSIDD
jgi:hypothetical protein